MTWLGATGLERRPLVFVEDHLYHTTEVLEALDRARPDLLAQITVCALDRSGPDTDAALADWGRRFPDVQVLASASTGSHPAVMPLAPDAVRDAPALARRLAALLRPGGLLVQDIQLSTLPFIPADRWWESIYIAATVRGLFADRAPRVRFMSNKRGYAATFGRDLLDAGFDPRDVMDKAAVGDVIVPTVAAAIDEAFPAWLRAGGRRYVVATDEASRREIEAAMDLVVWRVDESIGVSGRLVADERLALRAVSHEAASWAALVEDHLAGGAGLAVQDVGRRVGPPEAERAELSNVAARHVHALRARLRDAAAIVTADHRYRLRADVRAGVVDSRSRAEPGRSADLPVPSAGAPASIKVSE